MARKDDELLQTGRRRRASDRDGTPKIIWAALVVCLIGAALLFRGPGGDAPTGIGEHRSILTIPGDDEAGGRPDSLAAEGQAPADPRSGEVDLDQLVAELTPETPAGGGASAPAGQVQTAAVPPPSATRTESVQPQPARPKPKPSAPTPSVPATAVEPGARGTYLVQTGSYGSAENADKEAARLQTLGWEALVKVSDMADESIVYRVRIGYFLTRADAESFIRAHPRELPGAIPVHR